MKSKVSYIERFVKRIIISILMIRIKCSENRVHQQQVNKIQTHWGSYSQRMQFFLEENLNFTQPEVIKQVKKKKKKVNRFTRHQSLIDLQHLIPSCVNLNDEWAVTAKSCLKNKSSQQSVSLPTQVSTRLHFQFKTQIIQCFCLIQYSEKIVLTSWWALENYQL